jgi:signal transduction histidine kinase
MAEKAEREGKALETAELRLELDELDRILDRALGRMRLEDFELGSRVARVEVAGSAKASVRKHRRVLIARRIQVEVDGGFAAATDPWWLAFILDQLVSNAAKYARTRVRVSLAAGERQGRVAVEDDGPGLDEEDEQRVFGRSASGSAASGSERGPSSSGYGLYLAREAAGRLGARLELEAPAGGGTRAVLSLPLAAESFGKLAPM